MPLWVVEFESMVIEADTEDEAIDKAYEDGPDIASVFEAEQ